jgi:hypothetical protein
MYAFLHLTPGPEWPQRPIFILQTRQQATVVSQLGTDTPLLTLDTWQKWFPNWALMPGSQITLRHMFFLSGSNTKPKLQKKKNLKVIGLSLRFKMGVETCFTNSLACFFINKRKYEQMGLFQ